MKNVYTFIAYFLTNIRLAKSCEDIANRIRRESVSKLPSQLVIQYNTITSWRIVFCKAIGFVLNAKHQHFIFTSIFQCTFAIRSYTNNTAFRY